LDPDPVLIKMRAGDVMMAANLGASEPREIAFRLVRASAVLAVSLAMIDPLHFKAGVKVHPKPLPHRRERRFALRRVVE
jgi:hypothetical protein